MGNNFFNCWYSYLGIGSIVTSFFYNKLYASDLMKDGFKIKSLNGADKDLVKAKLGIAKL